ncbi:acylneuraminate cytidylyltransferase family protein [Dyadobacter sp. CY351]|uniref:acylneuraminate cytidylyltransferase family protein n=1 Tax=Dyadobacter sp. CY351 TaxID=2909337 RepID=UPI001F36F5BA|nr:acylneuraminate cytidylyltransferase family protein [Dyadobacter sp. CY351]MCF2520634.1 acylneuraminate cytidylyltransferase family protein [Dyadobacter sp. CY351]
MDSKSILAIIPARKGSKEIPGKNMRLLAGKPLIQYSIESALASELLTRIVVSSDCAETIAFAKSWEGVEAPFVRPSELAADDTPSLEVVKHAVNYFKEQQTEFDYICLLQPTSPCRTWDLIDRALAHMMETDADSLVTIRKIPEKYHPLWALGVTGNALQRVVQHEDMPTRRQELPDTFCRDGKIYLLKTTLLDKDLLMGGKMVGYEDKSLPDININTSEDWELAVIFFKIWRKQQSNVS